MLLKCKFCGYQGQENEFEIDHDPPTARITNTYGLLQQTKTYVCSGCNRQKGIKTSAEYLLWRLFNQTTANHGPIK